MGESIAAFWPRGKERSAWLERDDFTVNYLPVLDTGLGFFSALVALESLTPCQARGDESGSVKCDHALIFCGFNHHFNTYWARTLGRVTKLAEYHLAEHAVGPDVQIASV
jgi:hypothetical protein